MILNNNTNARSFIFCSVYFGPNESNAYFNSGPGHYHEKLYLIEGQAHAVFSDSKTPQAGDYEFDLTPDTLYDLKQAQGKYVITNTGDTGASMMMFNPIPDTRNLTVEILKGEQKIEISAGSERTTIVCITGPVLAKDKTLESLQFAVLLPDSSATLEIPQHRLCALVRG